MISNNINRVCEAFKVMPPGLEYIVNRQELLVVNVVVEFSFVEGAAAEGD